jgi:hypothetical protein
MGSPEVNEDSLCKASYQVPVINSKKNNGGTLGAPHWVF